MLCQSEEDQSLVTEPHRQSLVTTLPLTQHVAETSTLPSAKQLLHNQAYRKLILRDFLTSPCLRQTHTVIFCLYPYSIWIHPYPSLTPAQCPGQNSAPALIHPLSSDAACLLPASFPCTRSSLDSCATCQAPVEQRQPSANHWDPST